VQSICSGSSSAYSTPTSFTTLAPTCNIPSGLSASAVTTGSAVLNWASTGASSYDIMYKTSAASAWIGASSSTNSFSISGLSASTSYVFEVQSICSGNSSAYSTATSFTTLSTACNIPSGLFVSSLTTGSAVLHWASTGASSYGIMYKISAASTWTGASSTTNSLSIAGLTSSTSYDFQVQSNCSGSSSAYSTKTSFTTATPVPLACNIPGGLIASSITSNSATLSWASTGAVSYNVMYKSLFSTNWVTVSSSSTGINFSGLSPLTTYEFRVQSVCSGSLFSPYSSYTFIKTL